MENNDHLRERCLPEPAVLRRIFSGFPSGVAAISANVDGIKEVLVASTFTVGVSLDPPLVMFAVKIGSRSWAALKRAPVIGVSLFGVEHADVCRKLSAGPSAERFDDVEHRQAQNDAIYLLGAPAWLECTVWKEVPAGDHEVIILQISGLFGDPNIEPLVWHGSEFRRMEARK